MTLVTSKGTEIKIQCIGENSQEDLSKLVNLIKNNFGEEKPLSDNITKEETFKGIPVSHGYVIGNCFVMEGSVITYSKYNIAIYEIKKEHKRLDLAVKKAVDDLSKIIQKIKGSRNDIYQEMKFMLQANKSIITSSSLIKDSKKELRQTLLTQNMQLLKN